MFHHLLFKLWTSRLDPLCVVKLESMSLGLAQVQSILKVVSSVICTLHIKKLKTLTHLLSLPHSTRILLLLLLSLTKYPSLSLLNSWPWLGFWSRHLGATSCRHHCCHPRPPRRHLSSSFPSSKVPHLCVHFQPWLIGMISILMVFISNIFLCHFHIVTYVVNLFFYSFF